MTSVTMRLPNWRKPVKRRRKPWIRWKVNRNGRRRRKRCSVQKTFTSQTWPPKIYGHLVPGANREAVNRLPGLPDITGPASLPLQAQAEQEPAAPYAHPVALTEPCLSLSARTALADHIEHNVVVSGSVDARRAHASESPGVPNLLAGTGITFPDATSDR